ncbi:uncharacterized protein LOC109838822 [Asparagus officinalis]|uniref:uncharacterized protein LOC109838822 n=1 Tax=Asparagus officinalis TaxID=4686 RepID=UPI00098E2175|nr:uncharacterized protein LOC109838822 [Asparagus officinalis]
MQKIWVGSFNVVGRDGARRTWMRSIYVFVEVITNENGLNLEFPSNIICGGQFMDGLMGSVDELKVRPDLRPIDIKNNLFSYYGIKINYCKTWKSKERAKQELYGDDDEAYDSLRWYEAMVQATNPGSRVAIDANDERCRPLLFWMEHFLKTATEVYYLVSRDMTATKEYFLWLIVYLTMRITGNGSYKECGRYYMIGKSLKILHINCREFQKKKMKDLGHKANVAQILGDLLQIAAYKYTISKWDDYMQELASIDQRAYVTAMEYSPERWTNAYFPCIMYDNIV